jgi:hypothetical protein
LAGGTLNVSNAAVNANQALGGGGGYRGDGGGIYVEGGTVTLDASQLESNVAQGHAAFGGGLEVEGGTVTLTNDNVTGNSVSASVIQNEARGGGILIGAAATVYLDSSTWNNTSNNVAIINGGTSLSNIDGMFQFL